MGYFEQRKLKQFQTRRYASAVVAFTFAAAIPRIGHSAAASVTGPRDDVTWSSGGGCKLADLFLRAPADKDGNAQPIDIYPVAGKDTEFQAVMDYDMAGFDLEAMAVPRRECKVSRITQTTMMVDAGSYVMAQVEVQNVDGSGTYDSYSVKVSRLLGSETFLKWLQIDGAYLEPANFDPEVRSYTVFLGVDQDIVKFTFEQLDNGQVTNLVSEPEQPMVLTKTSDIPSARRLQSARVPILGSPSTQPKIGEVQHLSSTLVTTIDVGHQRVVYVTVASADKSANDRYKFLVKRPFCPEERRFFDGDRRVCTDICNEGYFGNPATGRCTACLQKNCAVCDDGLKCSQCIDGIGMQNGQCSGSASVSDSLAVISQAEATVTSYGSKHKMVMYAGACALALALVSCIGLAYCSMGGRRRNRLLDADDDELSTMGYYEESYRS